VTTTETPAQCPECGSTALRRVRTDPPWCGQCEWNLAQWPEPKSKTTKRARRALARDRRRAFETNRRLLAELEGAQPTAARRTRAGLLLAAASAALLLADLALLVGGVVLLISRSFLLIAAGVFMILIGIECRLRFYRFDTVGEVTREDAPSLWAVVDQAKVALGAPEIDSLVITNDFNAGCARSGIRRRVVLQLGLPLWGALSPAGRLALLGHELGHLVNGDPSTGLVTQPALATFGRLADIFDPRGLVNSDNVVAELLATVLAYMVFFPLHAACEWAHAGLIRVAMQDHQRAEAYADALAVRLGGSRGAEELIRVLLFDKSITNVLRRTVASSDDPAEWRAATARTLESCGTQLKFSEQSSMRYGVSRYLEHPPSGLRSRLVRSWSAAAPAVSVPAGFLAAADRELTRQYKSAARAIGRWSI
jgi:heat shock protein HtpX